MKILMLISSLEIGGAETHVCSLAAALQRRGQKVFLASAGGALEQSLEGSGVKLIRLPLASKDPLSLMRSYIYLRRLIKKERFDIVHAHSRLAAFIAEAAVRRSESCFVSTIHAKFSAGPIKKSMSKWGYYICAVSEDLSEHLENIWGIEQDRICVIPNGIDTSLFSPSNIRTKGRRRIVFASRLDSDCSAGAHTLCRIAPALACRYGKKIFIEIIGGGSESSKLLKAAANANRLCGYECVKLSGAVTDMPERIRGADAFLGVSRAALEAMSCGICTVLGGNEGFFGELCEENILAAEKSNFCARGCEPISDEAVFSSLCSVLDMSGSEQGRRSAFLRDHIKKNHSSETAAGKTLKFYRMARRNVCTSEGDVCLCGYYGRGNFGDDVLLRSAISRARKEYGDGISAITAHPRSDLYKYRVPCISAGNLAAAVRGIGHSRCLVFGGGSIFQDSTSLRSLLYYAALARIAVRRGVAVELWGNGLGPIKRRLSRKLLSKVLRDCQHIGLRDKQSVALALELGADREKIFLESDLALELFSKSSGSLRDLRSPNALICKRSISGIVSLSDPTARYALFAVSGRASKCDMVSLRREIESAMGRGISPVFVIMHAKEDRRRSLALSSEFSAPCLLSPSPAELSYLIASSDFVCSMRFHLLAFAKALKRPFIGIGSDPKIVSICGE